MPAAAATFVANPAAPDGAPGSLRQLVAGAGADDTIVLPRGTYRLTQGQLGISAGVTLAGAGDQAAQTVITAEGRSRVLSATPVPGQTITLRRLHISGGRAVGGAGAGILKQQAGSLLLEEVTLAGNAASGSQGGGGLAASAGGVTLRRSAIVNNAAGVSVANGGGAGILHTGGQLTLENATIAGNRLTVSGSPPGAGGSGLLTTGGGASLDSTTVAYNSSTPGGLGALRANGLLALTLVNSLASRNGGNCIGNVSSNGFNIDDDGSCNLDEANDDKPGIVPGIAELGDHGGPTPTVRLAPGSLAINSGTCIQSQDQRRAVRPAENEASCDVGAVEFEGWAEVEVPPCSRSGQLPFSVFSPPESGGVEALDYTIDGGNPQAPLRAMLGGGLSATGTITIPEGRRRLEYWADSFPTGTDKGVELKHHTPLVVVDRTRPQVAVSNPNPFKVFVIRRRANVEVSAADSISGLVVDPSGRRALDTSRRGAKTFAPGAQDLCTNQATAPFDYRVLAPGLGVRAVVERVKGKVLTRPAATRGAARASQKGRFISLREPREVPVRSLINARRGRVRVTSSRNARTAIQDGEFSGGVFQVLQSRRGRVRGLTELRLTGSSFRNCRRAARGRRASVARRRVIRRLRGNVRGRFRGRGRFSSATVRGTIFTVEDRCDGTLTKVARGRVAVRDFTRRKTIVLRAGKSYLARARR